MQIHTFKNIAKEIGSRQRFDSSKYHQYYTLAVLYRIITYIMCILSIS